MALSRPRRVIGGKVLDASALAALARRQHFALVWFDIAPARGLALYLPNLTLTEVRAVRPDAAPLLADLLTHPSVIVGELDLTSPPAVRPLPCDHCPCRPSGGAGWLVAGAAGQAGVKIGPREEGPDRCGRGEVLSVVLARWPSPGSR